MPEPNTNGRYDDLLLNTLEQMNAQIGTVQEEGRVGRRDLQNEIGHLRQEIAATREDIAAMRVRLTVLWAGASAIGGAVIVGVAKLMGMR